MGNAQSQFIDVIRAAGMEPPTDLKPGKFYRFPGSGKYRGNTAGWCILFKDGLGGCYGDWSTGLSEHWRISRETSFNVNEQEAFQKHLAEARKRAENVKEKAAKKALKVWEMAKPVGDIHPYMRSKSVGVQGAARVAGDLLVIPLRARGNIVSLQFIQSDGQKRFLRGGQVAGCYCGMGVPQDASTLCIAEGFATGATIHEATGYPVAVAFMAGNLKAVALGMRERFPDIQLIICADDDIGTKGNPGVRSATEAALAVKGLLAIPEFGEDRPSDAKDFNDMARLRGKNSVREIINRAEPPSPVLAGLQWPDPQPLVAKVSPEPYPLDALPENIRKAVEEVQGFTKAPTSMVASCALSALSMAIQALTDVKRTEGLVGPVSLYMLTIADSGERKSTCDKYFTKAIHEYEQRQEQAFAPALSNYQAAIGAWEAKCNGVKEKIRQNIKNKKSTVAEEALLHELEHERPTQVRVPRLLYTDVTPEALAHNLVHGWPSGGVVSAEAGVVFGSHGMGKDSAMRNLALLNVLWDGGSHHVDRKSSKSFVVRDVRFTMGLQVQEAALNSFFDRSEGLARGTGFLARFLVAWPDSTQGSRFFTEAPAHWPALESFNRRIADILEQPAPMDDSGRLTLPHISLGDEAKKAWVEFHDAVENQLVSGGRLHDVRDVASKTADNAARLAALFQVYQGGGVIGAEAFASAGRIAAWHLNEARRFLGELALPVEIVGAARLDAWLVEYCRSNTVARISRREVQRHVTPVYLRHQVALDIALRELVDLGRVILVQQDRRKEILVNPALLCGDSQ